MRIPIRRAEETVKLSTWMAAHDARIHIEENTREGTYKAKVYYKPAPSEREVSRWGDLATSAWVSLCLLVKSLNEQRGHATVFLPPIEIDEGVEFYKEGTK